jgi:ribosomal protein L11 methyltransferase
MENKKYIKLQFSQTAEGQNDQLVALLADIGFIGFEEEDGILKAFIEEENFSSNDLDNILKMIPVDYSKMIVDEENWNAQWESSFEPIIVNDFVAIRAAFHQPVPQVKHEIIITPKMSFGTGHHATTYMMIEQMEALDFRGKKVVDFGTGTAVLAILAERMGAISIDAIDYDEWSIENSIENVTANNCTKINLVKADTIGEGKVYDIILANINLNVIMDNLTAIKTVTKKGSVILLSGFIKNDEAKMLHALKEKGISQHKTIQNGDWICILAYRN